MFLKPSEFYVNSIDLSWIKTTKKIMISGKMEDIRTKFGYEGIV